VIHSDDAFSPVGLLVVRDWHTEVKEQVVLDPLQDTSIYYVDEELAKQQHCLEGQVSSLTQSVMLTTVKNEKYDGEEEDVTNVGVRVHVSSDQVRKERESLRHTYQTLNIPPFTIPIISNSQ
jgi:hypothetical protein